MGLKGRTATFLFTLSVVLAGNSVEAFTCPTDAATLGGPPLYADEAKCYVYHECLDNQAFDLECPFPLVFDVATSRCAVVTDCGERETWFTDDHGQDFFVCPEPNGLFPNDEFCYLYWNCGDNVPYEMECQGVLHYDIQKKYCEDPLIVECGNRKPRPGGETTTGKSTPTQTPYTGPSTSPRPRTTPSGGEFQCPTEEGLYPDPENCNNFYACANFVAFLESCPPGQQFNPTVQSCDFEFNVHCTETSNGLEYLTDAPTSAKPTGSPGFDCPEPVGNFPYPDDCHYFYRCEGGVPTLFWCGEGLFFDEEIGYCAEGTCSKANEKEKVLDVQRSNEKNLAKKYRLPKRKNSVSGRIMRHQNGPPPFYNL